MRRVIVPAALIVSSTLVLPVPAGAGEGTADQSVGAYIHAVGELRRGDPVPKFKAKDIYGATICLEDLLRSGRKPVLAFWSRYCQACIAKFNAMVTVQGKYAPQGLAVISVNTDGEYQKGEQEIRDFIAGYEADHNIKINFPVLYDERNWVPQAMRIEFLPTIVTVDPEGRVFGFYQKFSEAGEAEILAGIESLVTQLIAAYPAGAPNPAPGGSACPDKK